MEERYVCPHCGEEMTLREFDPVVIGQPAGTVTIHWECSNPDCDVTNDQVFEERQATENWYDGSDEFNPDDDDTDDDDDDSEYSQAKRDFFDVVDHFMDLYKSGETR